MTRRWARHNRRSVRLKGYDYAQPGAYFVTLCTAGRACLFGEIVDGEMRTNACGAIVRDEWMRSAQIRQEIQLSPGEFVVMPNHIHGIVWIVGGDVEAHGRAPLPGRATRPGGPPCAVTAPPAAFGGCIHRRVQIRRHQTD
jgi:hypothetical protein